MVCVMHMRVCVCVLVGVCFKVSLKGGQIRHQLSNGGVGVEINYILYVPIT